jgi:hypothetical protein
MRECREGLMGVETVRGEGDEGGFATPPVPIPGAGERKDAGGSSYGPPGSSPLSSRQSHSPGRYFTSSEEEDFPIGSVQQSPRQARSVSATASGLPVPVATQSSSNPAATPTQTNAPLSKSPQGLIQSPLHSQQPSNQVGKEKDPSKTVLSGYLMKCGSKSGSKRRSWKKRWFVLTGQKLYYSGSHMVRGCCGVCLYGDALFMNQLMTLYFQDTKPHRDIALEHILDALEDDSVAVGSAVGSPPHMLGHGAGQNMTGVSDDTGVSGEGQGCVFKIVTTKRTLVLSAPSEAEEIAWLSTVRALIARRSGPSPGQG